MFLSKTVLVRRMLEIFVDRGFVLTEMKMRGK